MPCPVSEQNLPEQVKELVSSDTPAKKRMMAARGLLPLPPADMVLVLFCLLYDRNDRIRRTALQSLNKVPSNIMRTAVSSPLPAPVLDYLARGLISKPELLEPLVLNPATPDETIERIGSVAKGSLLESIARNQQRIERHPGIAKAVLDNPATPVALKEFLKEFLERSGIEVSEPEEEIQEAEDQPFEEVEEEAWDEPEQGEEEQADLAGAIRQRAMLEEELDEEEEEEDLQFEVRGGVAVETVGEVKVRQRDMLAEEEEEEEGGGIELEFPSYMIDETAEWDEEERQSVEKMLSKMNPAEKVKLATLGNKMIRSMLVRDTNKTVALAAAKSPKITEGEMVAIAASRSVVDDVIRYAANNRDFLKLYQVKCNLVMNPKTPTGAALRLLNHLRDHDLRQVANSKNIPNVVSTAAKKRLKQRREKR